jgi:C-terminal processing protease CtpA/Prc
MAKVDALAKTAPTREAFLEGFNAAWREGPFSHVRLSLARSSAEQLADYLDGMTIGVKGARLEWQDDVAILTVDTMMGRDTIELIEAAYTEISHKRARALVIDLRRNEGGAFAVRPLVAHALSKPLDAGLFLSARWFAKGEPRPGLEAARALPAWDGWSLKSFWRDAQEQGMLRIRFTPMAPAYSGPLYVLTSKRTASAAELAADALQANGRATLVGEPTSGKMLSQKMYDVPGGLQLSLPIADYQSHHGGRIEGNGVRPDVQVAASEALARALALAAGS